MLLLDAPYVFNVFPFIYDNIHTTVVSYFLFWGILSTLNIPLKKRMSNVWEIDIHCRDQCQFVCILSLLYPCSLHIHRCHGIYVSWRLVYIRWNANVRCLNSRVTCLRTCCCLPLALMYHICLSCACMVNTGRRPFPSSLPVSQPGHTPRSTFVLPYIV